MTLTATTFPGLDPLLQSGVIAVVRLTEAVRLGPAARALAAGGVGAVEVTLTTPGAIDAIADLASDQKLAGCVIGAGIAGRDRCRRRPRLRPETRRVRHRRRPRARR